MISSTSWDKDKTAAAFEAEPLVSFLNSCLMIPGCQGTWWYQELGGLLSCSQLDSQLKADRRSAETNWKENDANTQTNKETATILWPRMGNRKHFRGWNDSCWCLCPNIILEWSWPYLDCLSSHRGHGWKWYCPELFALNRWTSQPGLWMPGQLPNRTGSFPLSALVQIPWQISTNVCLFNQKLLFSWVCSCTPGTQEARRGPKFQARLSSVVKLCFKRFHRQRAVNLLAH